MITRHGIIGAAERAVDRNIEASGYKILADMEIPDMTFEAIIVRYLEEFNKETVERAKMRLEEIRKL